MEENIFNNLTKKEFISKIHKKPQKSTRETYRQSREKDRTLEQVFLKKDIQRISTFI